MTSNAIGTTFAYDAEQRLPSAQRDPQGITFRTEYGYDGEGRRVTKVLTG